MQILLNFILRSFYEWKLSECGRGGEFMQRLIAIKIQLSSLEQDLLTY